MDFSDRKTMAAPVLIFFLAEKALFLAPKKIGLFLWEIVSEKSSKELEQFKDSERIGGKVFLFSQIIGNF